MKTNKSTKIFAILLVLLTAALTGCANSSSSSDSKKETKYTVETGNCVKSVYEGYLMSLESFPNLTSDNIKAFRDHFYNHTEEGTYEKKEGLSASAVKAILHQDLMPGSTPEEELEITDFMGNNLTFINVTDVNPYVTWVYIVKE